MHQQVPSLRVLFALQHASNHRRRSGEADGRRSSESPEVSPSRLRSGTQVWPVTHLISLNPHQKITL